MSTYSIAARVTLSGDGVSSDGINISELQTYNITQPTVESAALTVPTVKTQFSTFDGTTNTSARLLYIKNTGLPINGNIKYKLVFPSPGFGNLLQHVVPKQREHILTSLFDIK